MFSLITQVETKGFVWLEKGHFTIERDPQAGCAYIPLGRKRVKTTSNISTDCWHVQGWLTFNVIVVRATLGMVWTKSDYLGTRVFGWNMKGVGLNLVGSTPSCVVFSTRTFLEARWFNCDFRYGGFKLLKLMNIHDVNITTIGTIPWLVYVYVLTRTQREIRVSCVRQVTRSPRACVLRMNIIYVVATM